MADVTYDKYTVQGGSDTTLNKIATIKLKDVRILTKLNPNITSPNSSIQPSEIDIPTGTNVLVGVGSMTDAYDSFTTATLKVGQLNLEKQEFEIIVTDVNDGETTYYVGVNKSQGYPAPNISLQAIVDNKSKWGLGDIDISTIMNLNPSFAGTQTSLIPQGRIILVQVCVPGSQVTPAIIKVGLRINSDRTCYIKWDWDHKANATTGMEVRWKYLTQDGEEHFGSKNDVTDLEVNEATYSPDDTAVMVLVALRPKDKTISIGSATTTSKYQWTADQEIKFNDEWKTITPSAPSVEIKNNVLSATYDGLPVSAYNIKHVQFEIVRLGNDDNAYSVYGDISDKYSVDSYGYVRYTCDVAEGYKYRVRARCYSQVEGGLEYKSSWSELSNPVNSSPVAPTLHDCDVLKNNVVLFSWTKVPTAESYKLQYVLKNEEELKNYNGNTVEYFNSKVGNGVVERDLQVNGNSSPLSEVDNNVQYRETVANGHYLVRVASSNDNLVSDWSVIKEVILGKIPDSPTTWSSATTVAKGDTLILYWAHNPKDSSNETKAEIEVTVDGKKVIYTDERTPEENENNETSHYNIDTSLYPNGAKLEWRVRTAGVFRYESVTEEYKKNPNGYGEWSIKRTVDVYAPPVLNVKLFNVSKEPIEDKLRSLPLHIVLEAGNATNQTPTGYHVSVIAQNSYYTFDEMGNEKSVIAGTSVFSKYYNVTDTHYEVILTAGDLSLEINEKYTVKCTLSMSSGLIAEKETAPFKVVWSNQGYTPNANVTINKDALTASINPFAIGADQSVKLYVYRREFDGSLTPIISNTDGLDNTGSTWITDPHPALDYARYRIVCRNTNGVMNYFDIPSIPVQEKSVVIQWDEKWHSFDAEDIESAMTNTEETYTGSMLKLRYNIDVSNSHSPDVALVKYTGRTRPVSYYGTQRGEAATWNMEIPKSDKETLYALRRLAVYMGNVYVREPSGTGYWASISISFSQKHKGLTIPITVNVTPVEGGM